MTVNVIAGTRPTVVDLFAGAGLLSFAFAQEGFAVIRGIEIDPVAASTYARNLGERIEATDVRRAEPRGRCDVLIAGPPCQGFSTLGTRDPRDPRNSLCMEAVRYARVMRPSVVVVENVVPFLDTPSWKRMARAFERLGYEVGGGVYNAFDFGVPQLRSRSFTFASKRGLPVVRCLPGPRRRTVRQAWAGLPVRPNGKNHHIAPDPSPLALSRMQVVPPCGDKRDIMRRAPKLAAPSWWCLKSQITDVWGRMVWDQPSNTLRTALQNPSKGRYIHPEQHRVITLREAARLHSVSDRWIFEGWPTQIARQIGNSVPPRLGRAVAKAVYASLS